jgi:hypothetical protein
VILFPVAPAFLSSPRRKPGAIFEKRRGFPILRNDEEKAGVANTLSAAFDMMEKHKPMNMAYRLSSAFGNLWEAWYTIKK